MPQVQVPAGTVTLLFTDIEGSTKLWEAHPETMRASLAKHDILMRQAIASCDGYVFKTVGDAFCAAFATASDAVEAVLAAQIALTSEHWAAETPIKVRMALHTGSVEARDEDYFGPPVNRVARLLSTAHGGQSVISQTTFDLARDLLPPLSSVKDLGTHQLKDLARPEQVYQLLHPSLPAEFPPLRSLSTHHNNLPQQLTSFIGREKEIEALEALLEKGRLVTLTGSGGTGKSRLSLQMAADALDQFPDGAWLAELAPVTDPELVPATVAQIFNLKQEQSKPLDQTLVDFLKPKCLLLILDNCEHLLTPSARLADMVLRHCPQVRIIATSREGLGISGELTYRVPSLSLPNRSERQTAESLSQYEAVRLFIERAQAHQPEFAVTNDNAPALASVCQKLDGIPLAIELAASRLRTLTIEDINSRLDQRFRLLTGGSRTALPRQQTLRSLIDWSYDLLNEQEQATLVRCSAFSGGWTLEAADRVASGGPVEDWEVLDLLSSLSDKSLLTIEARGGSTRFGMLETVRQYALERLLSRGESEHVREAHLDYFLAMVETARPNLNLADGAEWRRRLQDDIENIRAALEFACSKKGDSACKLVYWLLDYWLNQTPTEGRAWAARALMMPCEPPSRCHALLVAGILACVQSEPEEAVVQLNEALEIAQALGDPELVAQARFSLGGYANASGKADEAIAHYSAALAHFQQTSQKRRMASAMGNLGSAHGLGGDMAEAIRLWEAALVIHREVGNLQAMAASLGNIGNAKYDAGDFEAARACKEEALEACRGNGWVWGAAGCLVTLADIDILEGNHGDGRAKVAEALQIFQDAAVPSGITDALQVFAKLAVAEGSYEKAARLYGAASALIERYGGAAKGDHGHEEETNIAESRSEMGDPAFESVWKEGRTMPVEEAMALALGTECR